MRIRDSSIKTLHQSFAVAAESWGDVSPDLLAYVYRHGIAHFLCIPKAKRAQSLLRKYEYSRARLARMGGEDARAIRDDHNVVEKQNEFCEAFSHQANFYRSHAHVLEQSDAQWPVDTLLYQLALDHGENSPMTQAAIAWSESNPTPKILHLENRPKQPSFGTPSKGHRWSGGNGRLSKTPRK